MGVNRAAVAWIAALVVSCGLLALPLVAVAATFNVAIQGFAFAPNTVPIRVGDTVVWTNNDGVPHSATSDTGVWNTGIFASGSRSFMFTAAGTYPYHCAVHATMTGTVVVQAAATPPPTAPPPPPPTTAPPPPPPPTVVPTVVRTAPPTTAPTDAPTADPTTASPTASPAPTAAQTLALASPSPSAAAVQLTPAPAASDGNGPLLVAAAAAVLGLAALAWFIARRT
jgi:plastocyanin